MDDLKIMILNNEKLAYNTLTKETNTDDLNNYEKRLGILNDVLSITYKNISTQNTDEIIPYSSFFSSMLNGDRNMFVVYPTSFIYDMFPPHKLNLKDNELKKYFDIITSFVSGAFDINVSLYKTQYMNTLAYMFTHMDVTEYFNRNALTDNETLKITPSLNIKFYEFKKLNKSLRRFLKNPEKHINELKQRLTFKDGFYYYEDNKLLCLHEMLLYEGFSINDVAKRCCDKNGKCKHCGTYLSITLDISTQQNNLNKTALNLIYSYIKILKIINDEEYIIRLLVHTINDAMVKIKLTTKSDAYTSLYIYKVYKGVGKVSKTFLELCENVWSKYHWTKEQVNFSIKDIKNLPNVEFIIETIKTIRNNKNLDEKLFTILGVFETSNVPKNVDIKQMTEMLMKVSMNYTEYVDYIKLNDISYPKTSTIKNVFYITNTQIEEFFVLWWKFLCPTNIIHNFKTNTCVHCGINENNVKDIFNKYKDKIIDILNVLQNIKEQQKIILKQNVAYKNEASTNAKFEPLIKRFENDALTYLIDLLSSYIHETFKKDDIIKVINYILKNKLTTEDKLYEEIKTVFIMSFI